MKIKGVVKNLKIFLKLKNDNNKICLGISLELLRAVGSVQFQIVPCSSSYYFSRSIGPFQCLVNANYRVLICCTCQFQSSSLFFVYFGFLCLQVSSVSKFHPDTRGQRWSLIQAHLFSCAAGREEHCKQISLACVGGVLAVSGQHWVCPRSGRVCFPSLHCSGSRLLCRGTVQSGPWVLCTSQV